MSLEQIRRIMEQAPPQFLGAHTGASFAEDPKHLAFTLARYKFVAKMLQGYDSVLEVGSGDGFGATLVATEVNRLVGIDVEEYAIEHRARNQVLETKASFAKHDMIAGPMAERFQAVYSLDVIEHIPTQDEGCFLANIAASTLRPGVLVIGTPNVSAAEYASAASQIGHVNLKSHRSLKEALLPHYEQVFMFGMNDEVLHTGFGPMCHYLIALAVGVKG